MSAVDQITDYLAAGQATQAALADALNLPQTSVDRALAHLSREDRVTTATITHAKTGRPMTVYRLAPQPTQA